MTDRILTRIDYRVANILIKQAYKLEVDCIGYSFCLIKHYYFLSVIHIKKVRVEITTKNTKTTIKVLPRE